MAMKQVTLRHQVVVNLRPEEVEKYGLEKNAGPADPIQGKGARVVTLPAGLVNIPEELAGHWFVKAAIKEGKQPLMGGPRLEASRQADAAAKKAADEAAAEQKRLDDEAAAKKAADEKKLAEATVIKPADELAALDDDALRAYLREAGKQPVAATAPRDKVLERIERLRPKVD